jgi:hypothetical protein
VRTKKPAARAQPVPELPVTDVERRSALSECAWFRISALSLILFGANG